MMSGKIRSASWMLAVLAMVLAPAARAADLGASQVAAVQIDPMQVHWSPQGDYERLVLTVSRPDGVVVRREFAAGELPVFDLAREAGGDGAYNWELRVAPKVDAATRKELAAARNRGDAAAVSERLRQEGRLPSGSMVQSGTFRVVKGSLVASDLREGRPAGTGDTGSQASKVAPKARGPVNPLDQVIADDLIVQGSACVGLDCVANESFGFDTVRLKENNTRIKFDDTSASAGFPANDWQLTANDSASGGANKFSIEDITGSKVPFTVTAGAATNSIFVDSTGRVGFRTSTPVLDLHVNTSNTPAMRLEQNNSGGFTAQTWDIAGNEANFFVRDVTGGSRLPFRIRPGAPTSSIDISADGFVGVGTASPSANLHVASSSSGTTDGKILVKNTSGTTAPRELMELNNNGGAILILKDTSQTPRWSFGTTGTTFVIDNQAHAGVELSLDQNGNLTITGVYSPSDRNLKKDIVPVHRDVLAKLATVPISTWTFKTDEIRHMGPMAQDFSAAFGLGIDDTHVSPMDMAGVSMAAVQALNEVVQEKDKEINELKGRIETLEKLVQGLAKAQGAAEPQK